MTFFLKFKKTLIQNKIISDILVEIIAIFLGVFIAFYIDDIKDENQKKEKAIKYFGMLKSEFYKDVSTLYQNQEILKREIKFTKKTILLIEQKKSYLIKSELNRFGEIDLFFPKDNLIETVLNSPDFTSIYNESIFGELNDLKSDIKIYDIFAKKQHELRDKILDLIINSDNINAIYEYLKQYDELLINKLMLNGSLITGYSDCIQKINNDKR